jgi:hypothetical protein
VAELAAEPAVAAEQLAAEDQAAADADLARGVHEVADADRGALPELGERGEVGLIVDAERQLLVVDALAQQLDDRHVLPVEVRRDEQRAVLDVDQTGDGDGRPDRPQALAPYRVKRAARSVLRGGPGTSATARPRLSAASIPL